MRIRLLICVAVCTVIGFSARTVAEPLRYRFKDTPQAVYAVSITVELPDEVDTHTGHISYTINSVDPATGQITLGYAKSLRVDRKMNQPDNNRFGAFPRPPRMGFPVMSGTPEVVIDPQGTVIRMNRAGDEDQLPGMMGLVWELMLPQLPPDQQPFKSEKAITLYTNHQQDSWPPAPPWERGDERTDRMAHETITETIGAQTADGVTVAKQYELATEEKVGDQPALKASGDGKFVFDTQLGLVRSMDYHQTIEINQKNMTVKVPVTVTARLLNADELAKFKADQAASQAKMKDDLAKMQARNALEHANEVRDLPAGCTKTEMVGGNGGGPYIKIHKDRLPVIGFTIRIGNWAGHPTIGHAEPLFEKPADMHPDGATVVLAKDGYVVGGLIVYKKDGADGLKIIFVKKTPTGVDAKDRYTSNAYGYIENTTMTQLAGKGEQVIGTFGRQGLNMDAIGLVLAVPDLPSSDAK